MTRITCLIRPYKLEQVKSAIAALGVTGLHVSDVRGVGNSAEKPTWFAGEEHLIALPLKSKIQVVVADHLVTPVIDAIIDNARTGEAGDGKIFVERVRDAIRIRTGERGDSAV